MMVGSGVSNSWDLNDLSVKGRCLCEGCWKQPIVDIVLNYDSILILKRRRLKEIGIICQKILYLDKIDLIIL